MTGLIAGQYPPVWALVLARIYMEAKDRRAVEFWKTVTTQHPADAAVADQPEHVDDGGVERVVDGNQPPALRRVLAGVGREGLGGGWDTAHSALVTGPDRSRSRS